jgi:hypothetical protein
MKFSTMVASMQAYATFAKLSRYASTAFIANPKWITKVKCTQHFPGYHLTKQPFSAASFETEVDTTLPQNKNNNDQQQLVQDMLYRIRQVRHVPTDIRDSLLEFRVDGIKLGQVRPNIAKLLCSFHIDTTTSGSNGGAAFRIEWDDNSRSYLTLTEICGTTFQSRSEAISKVTSQMKENGIVTGWRDELFPVSATFYSDPVFAMERAAISFLGVIEYGVHIVGVVQESPDQENVGGNSLRMWMARRSATKSKWPGMMDHIAAGGQPIGLSLTENVVKECLEEAGIEESITRKGLRPAGAVTYENYVPSKDVVVSVVFLCFFYPKKS